MRPQSGLWQVASGFNVDKTSESESTRDQEFSRFLNYKKVLDSGAGYRV